MKIDKIEVENFRSIKNYNFNCTDYNVFIGQNNHGKTNFFEALSWFDSGKVNISDYHNNNKDLEIVVRIHYKNVQKGIEGLENEDIKKKLKNKIGEHDEIIVEKKSSSEKRSMIIDGNNVGNPQGFDSAMNYFLPKIEYVTTAVRLGDVSGYKSKSPIAEMLSGVLADIIEHDSNYKDFMVLFNKLFHSDDSIFRKEVSELEKKVEFYLQKQFSDGAIVDFKISDPVLSDMLKGFETFVDDGIRTRAEEKGDGMKRAIMLAIIQSYADYRKEKNIARNFIFLIDEAELHLHPSAQRALKNALGDIIDQGGQVFINSHSSIFATEEVESQSVFEIKKEDGDSNIKKIESQQERLDTIYSLLGGSPNDLLLPRNFIIVEGQSEFHFLQKIINKYYSELASNIKILFARGDSVKQEDIYYRIAEAYTPLHTNGVYRGTVVFLFDKPNVDQEKSFQKFIQSHPWLIEGEQLHLLDCESLEEAYPDEWKKNKGELNPEEKVSYAINVAESITKEDFEQKMPIIYQMLSKAIDKSYQ